MRRTTDFPTALGYALACAVGLGAGAFVSTGVLSAGEACEFNACSIAVGNCGITDLRVSCKEIIAEPHCETYAC